MKEEASQVRSSDTLHVDPAGLVTLTTPNRLSTISVRAIPLPQGEIYTQTAKLMYYTQSTLIYVHRCILFNLG